MATINGTSASKGLYQYLQTVSAENNATLPTNTSNNSTAAQTLVQQLSGKHHKHNGLGFMQQIQQAVSSALKSSKNNGTVDSNQVVQDAIAQVLNGSASISGATGSGNDGDNDSDGAAAGGLHANTAAANSASSFFLTLQSYGISPAQFREDFLSAIQNVQGTQANPASVLSKVPSGLTVDTLG